ncbi:hypothetical protein FNF27_02761 [Cafeteria roenbergensis]|uniref:Uncharacterized protein n=1 Tax=Cafeteria roenbergensis TaxID=33653 RepID=A0A5A8EIE8_CAFRO|nr:hypothetical protein FNF27_02761 [Cafeteria roenbergensis]
MEAEIFETSDDEPGSPMAPAGGAALRKQVDETFEEEGSAVEGETIDPLAAFETFMGRSFDPSEARTANRASGHIAAAYGSIRVGGRRDVAAADREAMRSIASEVAGLAGGRVTAASRPRVRDTPLSRLAALQAGAADLEAEIQAMEEDARRAGRSEDASEDDAIARAGAGLQALRGALAGMGDRLRLLGSAPVRASGGSLTARLEAAERAASAAAAEEEDDVAGEAREGSLADLGAVDEAAIGALEARVAELESCVGPGEGAGGGDGLAARLQRLEEVADALEAGGAERVEARAKAASVELAALSAAARESADEAGAAMDVVGLREAMLRLEAVEASAEAVPLVVARLEALAGLHERASAAVLAAEKTEAALAAAREGQRAALEAAAELREALKATGAEWAKTAAAVDARLDAREAGAPAE